MRSRSDGKPVGTAVALGQSAFAGAAYWLQVGTDFGAFHPRGRRAAIADAHFVALLQLLAQQPHAVDRFHLRGRGALRALGPMHRDIEARARPALDLSGRHQPLIGFDDGVLRNTENLRSRADRGQPLAGTNEPALDPLDDRRDDGFDAGSGVAGVDLMNCTHETDGTGLPENVQSVPCPYPSLQTVSRPDSPAEGLEEPGFWRRI